MQTLYQLLQAVLHSLICGNGIYKRRIASDLSSFYVFASVSINFNELPVPHNITSRFLFVHFSRDLNVLFLRKEQLILYGFQISSNVQPPKSFRKYFDKITNAENQ